MARAKVWRNERGEVAVGDCGGRQVCSACSIRQRKEGRKEEGLIENRKYLPANRVAIVCSARSTESKELGTTNR